MTERADFKTRFSSTNQPVKTGRKVGSRDKITSDFLRVLCEDFEENGPAAVQAAREKDPMGYVKVVAGLLPKEIEIKNPLDGMSDDEMADTLAVITAELARRKNQIEQVH